MFHDFSRVETSAASLRYMNYFVQYIIKIRPIYSYCNWTPCTCAYPRDFAAHWDKATSDPFLNCAAYLGEAFRSVPRGIFNIKDSSWTCCEDTETPFKEYNNWLTTYTGETSVTCKDYTAQIACLREFFPCASEVSYAPFLCSDGK